MSESLFEFESMIAPIDEATFFRDYWEKKPLIVAREQKTFYSALLTESQVKHLISSKEWRAPSIRLVKNEFLLPPQKYSTNGVAEVEKVFAEYENGVTIVLNALHRFWDPLLQLCQRLEKRFERPVWSNIYMTPETSQGFLAHYDTHDVFALQVAGSKEWRIYDSPLPLPLESQPYEPKYLQQAHLLHEVTLHAGDFLYLPRGYIHEALTSDSASVHVTVGIGLYTFHDLLMAAIEKMSHEDLRLRQAVPFDSPERSALVRENLSQLVNTFAQSPIFEQAIKEQLSGLLSGRTSKKEAAEFEDLERLTSTSLVRKKARIDAELIEQGQFVILLYQGQQIKGPKFIAEALRFANQGEEFEVAALPGRLKEAAKLVLIRRLIKEGFLTIVRY